MGGGTAVALAPCFDVFDGVFLFSADKTSGGGVLGCRLMRMGKRRGEVRARCCRSWSWRSSSRSRSRRRQGSKVMRTLLFKESEGSSCVGFRESSCLRLGRS